MAPFLDRSPILEDFHIHRFSPRAIFPVLDQLDVTEYLPQLIDFLQHDVGSILGVGAMQTVCAQNDFLSERDKAPCSRSSMLIFEFAVGAEIRNLRKTARPKLFGGL